MFSAHAQIAKKNKYLAIWLFDCVQKYISSTRTLRASISNIDNIDIHVNQISIMVTWPQYCNTLHHRNKCSLESKTTSQREPPNCGQTVYCSWKSTREKTFQRSKRIKISGCSSLNSEIWPKETKVSQESEHQLRSLVENKLASSKLR